jgi:hypothetical protein
MQARNTLANDELLATGEGLLLADVLDASDTELVVLDCDARVLQWNRWMVDESGAPAARALGTNLVDLFPDAGTRLIRSFDQALRQGLRTQLGALVPTFQKPTGSVPGRRGSFEGRTPASIRQCQTHTR